MIQVGKSFKKKKIIGPRYGSIRKSYNVVWNSTQSYSKFFFQLFCLYFIQIVTEKVLPIFFAANKRKMILKIWLDYLQDSYTVYPNIYFGYIKYSKINIHTIWTLRKYQNLYVLMAKWLAKYIHIQVKYVYGWLISHSSPSCF